MTNLEKLDLEEKILDTLNERNCEPTCRLTLLEEPFGLTESHLGGIPYIPHDQEIPTNIDGEQLWLCAQINFAEMPPLKHFPTKGILQIYLSNWHFDGSFGIYSSDTGEQDYWRVVYYDTIDETVSVEDVMAKMTSTWDAPKEADVNYWRTPDYPVKVQFNPIEPDNMSCTDYRYNEIYKAIEKEIIPADKEVEYIMHKYTYSDPEVSVVDRLNKIRDKSESGGCKIGGYSHHAQLDPRDDDAGLDDFDTLLFQLDDNQVYFPCGADVVNLNGGTLNLFINHKDLEELNFTKIIADWACS